MASLDDLEIARPCDASWEAMRGDDRVRTCDTCRREVVDLAAHTRAEVEAIAALEAAKRPCLRITRDGAGRVLTSVGRRLPLVLGGAMAVAACGPAGLQVTRWLVARPAPAVVPTPPPAVHSGVVYYTTRSVPLDLTSCSIPTTVLGVGR